jgi:hypothetical protein
VQSLMLRSINRCVLVGSQGFFPRIRAWVQLEMQVAQRVRGEQQARDDCWLRRTEGRGEETGWLGWLVVRAVWSAVLVVPPSQLSTVNCHFSFFKTSTLAKFPLHVYRKLFARWLEYDSYSPSTLILRILRAHFRGKARENASHTPANFRISGFPVLSAMVYERQLKFVLVYHPLVPERQRQQDIPRLHCTPAWCVAGPRRRIRSDRPTGRRAITRTDTLLCTVQRLIPRCSRVLLECVSFLSSHRLFST